jgi:hypothetical protein
MELAARGSGQPGRLKTAEPAALTGCLRNNDGERWSYSVRAAPIAQAPIQQPGQSFDGPEIPWLRRFRN